MPKAPVPAKALAESGLLAPASYEAAVDELEQLVVGLESGKTPLDQLLSAYQRGAELLKYCRSRLEAVEDQIKVLDDGVIKSWSEP